MNSPSETVQEKFKITGWLPYPALIASACSIGNNAVWDELFIINQENEMICFTVTEKGVIFQEKQIVTERVEDSLSVFDPYVFCSDKFFQTLTGKMPVLLHRLWMTWTGGRRRTRRVPLSFCWSWGWFGSRFLSFHWRESLSSHKHAHLFTGECFPFY